MRLVNKGSAVLGVLALASAQSVLGSALVGGFNSSSLAGNDDLYTGLVNVGFNLNYFGNTYNSVYANNNGNITFTQQLGTFTPFQITGGSLPIIAAFFGDVDTRPAGSELMRYGAGTFDNKQAWGVTWDGVGVGYYANHVDKLNKFQLLLVNRSDVAAGDFDIYFNYDQIQWETGDASGGHNGLGGTSAAAGYSNGDGVHYYQIPGSLVNGAFLDGSSYTGIPGAPNGGGLVAGGNTGVDGRYLFQVRNGVVVNPPPTGVPEFGTTFGMLGLGLAGLLGLTRKSR